MACMKIFLKVCHGKLEEGGGDGVKTGKADLCTGQYLNRRVGLGQK